MGWEEIRKGFREKIGLELGLEGSEGFSEAGVRKEHVPGMGHSLYKDMETGDGGPYIWYRDKATLAALGRRSRQSLVGPGGKGLERPNGEVDILS